MYHPIENKNCYTSREQRKCLLKLINHNIIKEDFFLTGGTALSVFYLHHRTSNDFDFFTLQNIDLAEIDFIIRSVWKRKYSKIKESPTFLSLLVDDIKVDFVIDALSSREKREKYVLESNKFLFIDTINNIVSNKLCAIVSRVEPKDFIDFYYINSLLKIHSIENIYNKAQKKDAIFDDPPTAAYQIEEGIQFLKRNPKLFPDLKLAFNKDDFYNFYHNIISWIYNKI